MANAEQNSTKPSGPRKLSDMIAVQEGSVVSRVLAKKKSGNVTLFSFGKGEGLSEHTSPFEALVYGVEGTGRIEIAGQPFDLAPGEILTLPASVPHAIFAVDDFKMLLIMLRE